MTWPSICFPKGLTHLIPPRGLEKISPGDLVNGDHSTALSGRWENGRRLAGSIARQGCDGSADDPSSYRTLLDARVDPH